MLEIALPFLGSLEGIQTTGRLWTPLMLYFKPKGELCPWQFEHVTAV